MTVYESPLVFYLQEEPIYIVFSGRIKFEEGWEVSKTNYHSNEVTKKIVCKGLGDYPRFVLPSTTNKPSGTGSVYMIIVLDEFGCKWFHGTRELEWKSIGLRVELLRIRLKKSYFYSLKSNFFVLLYIHRVYNRTREESLP